MNLMEVGGRWNIVDNTYSGNICLSFTNKNSENLYIYILYIYK